MPADLRIRPDLPVISDGHQFRIGAAQVLFAGAGQVHRVLLIEDAAVTIGIQGTRKRLDPPVLALLPPGWPGRLQVARGAFCYRLDLDAGPGLASLLAPEAAPILAGAEVGPWRGEVIALAQRWWRSLAERRRAAVHMAALVLRIDEHRRCAVPLDDLAGRFQVLVRTHLGSNERAGDFAARLGVSRATLDRAMDGSCGMTAAAWLRSERLRVAADLLQRTDRRWDEIGRSVGFRDADSFVRAFRCLHGGTPRHWRRVATARMAGPVAP